MVDDEPKIRELVRAYLERDGHAVLASSGQQALEVGARARPDLVVLDLMLPDLPGEEVARSLRALSDVPIVMLTAKTSEQDRVAGLRLGADDYLVKPFSPRAGHPGGGSAAPRPRGRAGRRRTTSSGPTPTSAIGYRAAGTHLDGLRRHLAHWLPKATPPSA